MRTKPSVVLFLLGCLVLFPSLIPTPATAQDSGTTTRISVASDGSQANGRSEIMEDSKAISADGRYVVFMSQANNLIGGGTNGQTHIFVHDRQTGETTRVSVASDGVEANSRSAEPSISPDGRYVVFASQADNLASNDTNSGWDVFLHDRQTGQTTRVSVASDGTQADGDSGLPFISADGRYVAFWSSASNLVSEDTNGYPDIFVHDRQTGQTTRVSVASDGTQANSDTTGYPSISADGRYVAFHSAASNLVSEDTNGYPDIFVHDRQTGQTTRVSVASDGTETEGGEAPSISADGRYVAFHSSSDVFVHDRQTGETTRVSVASDGTQANLTSSFASISGDGRYVAFESAASNLVSNDTNHDNDVFVHDRQTGQTTRVSVASDGTQAIYWSGRPAISSSGRYVVFTSYASNLVSDDTNNTYDVFVHDRGEGIVLPPTAAFTSDVTSGPAPLTVHFTDLSTGTITSYVWNFGDGGTSTERNPVHTFTAAGTYTVALTVSGPGGSDSAEAVITVETNTCTVSGVPLLKQGVLPYTDSNPSWEGDDYDSSGKIAVYGCAMTSAAMLLNQQGVQVDPGQLNAWLRGQEDGYKGGDVGWLAVARYARERGVTLYYNGKLESRNDSILNNSLCQLHIPVILKVSGLGGTTSHFVLATGQTQASGNQTWTINDPAFNRTNLLAYGNDYKGLRLFSSQSSAALISGGTSSIEVLVTDPAGRQTGFEVETGAQLENIPNSHYSLESIADDVDSVGEPTPGEKIVEIMDPVEGVYTIQTIGIENAPYTMHFFGYDTEQNPTGLEIVTGQAFPGTIQTYLVSYASAPGSAFQVERVVSIDIKPGSTPNSINCSNKNGVIAVAILATDDFDATTVNHATVTFEGASETHVDKKSGQPRRHEEDVDGDGDTDLVFHFRLGDTGLTCNSTEGTLIGQTFDGLNITGTDVVRMVGSVESSPSTPTEGCFEETNPAWKFQGDWMPHFQTGASGGVLLSYSSNKKNLNGYAEFDFVAGGFGLVFHKSPYGGMADIFVDNMTTPYIRVDMYAETDRWLEDAVLQVTGLDPAVSHTLRIVPIGKKNPLSKGYAVDIDRIDLPIYDNCVFHRRP
jgi:PKD repeat protein